MSITAYKIESVGHDRTGKDYGYVNIMYRYGNKRSCPQPDQCEKMEVMFTVSPGGGFTAWYEDDDMFWGHAVEVSGSLKKGITYANLAG